MFYKERIKEIRDQNNITQETIAKELNIARALYTQYEIETKLIPIKHLNTITNFFHVSLDYIFEFTNIQSYKNSKNEIDLKLSGKRLKELRKENKLTQDKLALLLNTTRTVISGYEVGRYIIATPFLYTICKKYKISADYLLGKVDTPKYLK